jgi:hypothetical protein
MRNRSRFVEDVIRNKSTDYKEVELELLLSRDENGASLGEGDQKTCYQLQLIAEDPKKTVDLSSSKDTLRDSRALMKTLSQALGIPAREKRDGTTFVYGPADWDKCLRDFVDEGKIRLPDALKREPPFVSLEADENAIHLKIKGAGKGTALIGLLGFFVAPALLWGSICGFNGHPYGGLFIALLLLGFGLRMFLNSRGGDEHIEIGAEFLSYYVLKAGKKKRTEEWKAPISSITRIGGPLVEIIAGIEGCPVGDAVVTQQSHVWLRKFLTAAIYKRQSQRIPSVVSR